MLRIGELAKLVGLSVKTIRLYQDKELLMPARVDPWTGYRYYDQAAIERARVIVRLRGFQFSLREIRDILAHGEDSANILEFLQKQRIALQRKAREYNAIINRLDVGILNRKRALMATEHFPIDRNIERRISQWLERVTGDTPEWTGEAFNFTVCSSWGIAGGNSLAVVLGKQVGFDVWDHELIAAIAEDPPSCDTILSALDEEQRAARDELLDKALCTHILEHDPQTLGELRLVASLAVCGRAILLEMGANWLAGSTRALRVRLVPNMPEVLKHHAGRAEQDADATREDLDRRGRVIESFITRCYDKDVHDPAAYDMVLNSSSLNLFAAVELCLRGYQTKFSAEPGWWYA